MVKKEKNKKQELEEVEEEYPGELKGEGFIDELDEEEKSDEVPEIDPPEQEEWKKYFESFQIALTKHQEAITINQKYIKKIWERVKQNEDNFKTLLEKIQ